MCEEKGEKSSSRILSFDFFPFPPTFISLEKVGKEKARVIYIYIYLRLFILEGIINKLIM
jgi:hypothetical protein